MDLLLKVNGLEIYKNIHDYHDNNNNINPHFKIGKKMT